MIACNDPEHEAQRAETRPLYCWDCGGRMRPSRSLATVARYACEGCGLDSPATILIRKQARASEPCLVCGAPILDGIGHDDGCMVAPAPIADYIAEIRRDIEAAGL